MPLNKTPREGDRIRLLIGHGNRMPIGSVHTISRVSVSGRMVAVLHPTDQTNTWLSLNEVERWD